MTRLEQTIRKARRRGTFNRMLHTAGIGAALGLLAALAALAIDRLGLLGVPAAAYIALPAVGLVLGAIMPLLRLPELSDVALQIDRAMRFKDRIATAHSVSMAIHGPGMTNGRGPLHDESFAQLVRRDGETLAAKIDVRSIAPVRITGVWGGVVALAVVLWLGFTLLPQAAWGDGRTPEQRAVAAEEQEQREREREELRLTIDEAVAELPERDTLDERTQAELEALDRLAEQLQAADLDGVEAQRVRDEAAARLNQLSERMAERARQERLASEKLAEQFRGMETPEVPMTAQEFDEALRRGDFGRAADSLEELLERRDQLSPEQRRELAEHMQRLNEQIDHAGMSERQDLDERSAQLEQALRDYGIDEEAISELLDAMPEATEDIERDLREQNVDEDLARRLAREIQRMREQRAVDEQVQRDKESIRETLREAAEQFDSDALDELDEPEDPFDPAEPDAPRPEQPDEPREQPEQPSPDDPRQPEQDPQQQQQEQQQQEQREQQQREQQEQRQQQQQDPDAPGEQRAQEDPEAQQEQQREVPDPDAPRDPETGEPAPDPDADPDADPQADPDAQPGVDPEADPDADPEADPQQQRSPGDALREMQQRRQAAEDREQSSQRMRERARRMADPTREQDDPAAMPQVQQRQQPGEAGMDHAGDTSPGTPEGEPTPPQDLDVDDLDLRDPDAPPGELIAEWLSDQPIEGDPQTMRGESERRVRQAQEIAERAVNEAAVPSRYHDMIRRYFGRLNETVDRAASGAASGAEPPAQDSSAP